jgi:hypothetical protein
MPHHLDPLQPLEIARRLDVPLRAISIRLGITERWLRELARNPRHARRVRVAELQAALEREQAALVVDHLLEEVGL